MEPKEFEAKLWKAFDEVEAERHDEIAKLRKAKADIDSQIHQIETEVLKRVLAVFSPDFESIGNEAVAKALKEGK